MVDSGILLFKYWLEVSPEEQTRRLTGRIDDSRKIWKLKPDGRRVLHPLGRLHDRQGRHVRGHQHVLGAMVRRQHRRQEARSAQRDLPPAVPRPLRARRRREGGAAEAVGDGGAAPAGRRPPRT